MPTTHTDIAIIGGGLCGLALAAALAHRGVPFIIYEARSSFTEIGAGINLGPNVHRAFSYIDSELGKAISKMCTRNPAPKEDVWMQFRCGAPTSAHEDYELMFELDAPPIGNMTAHRNELLQMLANRCPPENVVFNKKLVQIDQTDQEATMHFEDGSSETASLVIACDGIHSNARPLLRHITPEQSEPRFTNVVAYRGLLTPQEATDVFGPVDAMIGQLAIGPGGYLVKYGIAGGEHIAIGLWTYHKTPWPHKQWVVRDQAVEMQRDFQAFGGTMHRLMAAMPEPTCWATFAHTQQPKKIYDGRLCLIGDAAHSMPPHGGAGSGQAMEDACVMAEVLSTLHVSKVDAGTISSAFDVYDSVRTPRSQKVLGMGIDGMAFCSDFWRDDLTKEDVAEYRTRAEARWHSIWNYDVAAESQRARELLQERLA